MTRQQRDRHQRRRNYLSAIGRRGEPSPTTECPTWFTWSAFGARYPDTYCHPDYGHSLFDLDSEREPETPCPMHDPTGFYEWMFGGSDVIPTCARCQHMLPSGTAIVFHELGDALAYSADCPRCCWHTWTLMRAYEDDVLLSNPVWETAA